MSAAEPVEAVEASPVEPFAAIRSRESAASSGPWFWRGNVDHDDPALCRHVPGAGRVEVLRHYNRDREVTDPGARSFAEYLRDTQIEDGLDEKRRLKFRPYTDEEIAERVRTEWLEDDWGGTQTDHRLAFVDQKHYMAIDARELAIFEVCPDATKRDDPRVYRADIIGIRHPDAEFMAHARQDVADLLAAVDRIAALHVLVEYRSEMSGDYWSACQACGYESDDLATDPCPTLTALRGDS